MKMSKRQINHAAKRVARKHWGKVLSQTELGEGLWHFYCANNDGIVVDADMYPVSKQWALDAEIIRWTAGQTRHFAAFAEGAPWNICEWLLADRLYSPTFRTFFAEERMSDIAWYKMRAAAIRSYMTERFPHTVAEFPEEGIVRLEASLLGDC